MANPTKPRPRPRERQRPTGAVTKVGLVDMKADLDKALLLNSDINAASSGLERAKRVLDETKKKKAELEAEIRTQEERAKVKRKEAEELLKKAGTKVQHLEANVRTLKQDPSFLTMVRMEEK